MNMNETEKYYTTKQAAEECGVSLNTIKRAIKNEELKANTVPGMGKYGWKYMISETDLFEWIEHGHEQTARQSQIIKQKYNEMTVEQLAGRLLNMVQEAYKQGYEDGMHSAKVEMLKKLNEVE